MRTNILLAIDVPAGAPRQISAEKDLLRELIRDSADHVIVLHVQEFSIPRLAANMLDHGGASGRSAVDKIVAALRAAGIHASGLVREADFGHVGETILTAADEFDARVIVLGSRARTQFPRGPPGRREPGSRVISAGAGVAAPAIPRAKGPAIRRAAGSAQRSRRREQSRPTGRGRHRSRTGRRRTSSAGARPTAIPSRRR